MNKTINLIGNNKGRLFVEDFSNSIILTYSIDLVFWEQAILSQFIVKGSKNNVIIGDSLQMKQTMNSQATHLSKTSMYSLISVDTNHLFHPKTFWLSSKDKVRLFLGSGNLTTGGLSANRELYYEFDSTNELDFPVILDFKKYILDLLPIINPSSFFKQKIEQAINILSLNKPLQKTRDIYFINNLNQPILDQIKNMTQDTQKITAIAPFVDKNFATFTWLKENISSNIDYYVQRDYNNIDRSSNLQDINLYDFPGTKEHNGNLHAKCIIFERKNNVDILFGSPNLTKPALLSDYKNGNFETAVFIKNMNKDVLSMYLPVEKIAINIADLTPIKESIKLLPGDFTIIKAIYTRDAYLEIQLKTDAQITENTNININNQIILKVNFEKEYDQNTHSIKARYILKNDQQLVFISLIIDGKETNKIIICDENNNINSFNKNESSLLNELIPLLASGSEQDLLFIVQMDGFTKVENSIKEIGSENKLDFEDDELEPEKTEEKKEFYLYENDIVLKTDNLILTRGNSSFFQQIFSDLLSTIKRHNKEKTETLNSTRKQPSPINSKEINYEDISKRIVHRIEDKMEDVRIFKPKNQSDFISLYRIFSRTLPLMFLLVKGIRLDINGTEKIIVWKEREINEKIILITEMLYNYWLTSCKYLKEIIQNISLTKIYDFYILNIFTLIWIMEILKKGSEFPSIQGKKDVVYYYTKYILLFLIKNLSSITLVDEDFLISKKFVENRLLSNLLKNNESLKSSFDRIIQKIQTVYEKNLDEFLIQEKIIPGKSLSISIENILSN